MFNTYFVETGQPLNEIFKNMAKYDDIMCVIIFNKPTNNVFENKGVVAGHCLAFHSIGFWRGHIYFMLFHENHIEFGSMNPETNQLDSYCQFTGKEV